MRWRSCLAQRTTAAPTALLRQGERAWQATSPPRNTARQRRPRPACSAAGRDTTEWSIRIPAKNHVLRQCPNHEVETLGFRMTAAAHPVYNKPRSVKASGRSKADSRWREMRACNDNACGESKDQNSDDSLLDLTFLIAATDPKSSIY